MAILIILLGLLLGGSSGLFLALAICCFCLWAAPGWGVFCVILWLLD